MRHVDTYDHCCSLLDESKWLRFGCADEFMIDPTQLEVHLKDNVRKILIRLSAIEFSAVLWIWNPVSNHTHGVNTQFCIGVRLQGTVRLHDVSGEYDEYKRRRWLSLFLSV